MSYKLSAKNRRFHRIFQRIIQVVKMEGLSLSHAEKAVFIGVVLATIGLFINWIDSTTTGSNIVGNSFYKLLGITGYILILFNSILLFLLLGRQKKETIKSVLNLHAKDAVLITFVILASFLVTLNNVFVITNIEMFIDGAIFGKGLILSLVGYILASVGAIINLYTKSKIDIYISTGSEPSLVVGEKGNPPVDKNNMKLPF